MAVCNFCHRVIDEISFFRRPYRISQRGDEMLKSSASCFMCKLFVDNIGQINGTAMVEHGSMFPPCPGTIDKRYISYKGEQIEYLLSRKRNRTGGMGRGAIWNPKSPISLDARLPVIVSWVSDCLKGHPQCASTREYWPTRVIDIGFSDASTPPKLVYSENIERHGESYVTLSHCWGSSPDAIPRTTIKNEPSYQKAILLADLPKSYSDAILVTRKFGIRYLWIDSLCIIQDSLDDWQHEASLMSSVFESSLLTLAATSSVDGHGGLFLDSLEPSHEVSYDHAKPNAFIRMLSANESIVQHSPLNQRAWVLQELLLSKRTVHFAKDQVYWQCHSRFASEDRSIDKSGTYILRLPKDRSLGSWLYRHYSRLDKYRMERWWLWVHDFTLRRLSNRGDRLAALAGITRFYQRDTGQTPVLGMWQEMLAQDLCWTLSAAKDVDNTLGTLPPELEKLPSWTWLVHEGCVVENSFANLIAKPVMDVLGFEINWEGEPLTSRCLSATLTLSAYVKTLILSPQKFTPSWCLPFAYIKQKYCFLDPWSLKDIGETTFSAPCLFLAWREEPLFCGTFLVLQRITAAGLIPTYRRIGVGLSVHERVTPFENVEKQVISLV